MSVLTRRVADLLATAMANNPDKVFQLCKNGDFGVLDDGGFKSLYRFDPQTKEPNNLGVIWKQSVRSLTSQDERLKYKTHLAKYLYQVLTPIVARVKLKGLTGNAEIDAILKSEKYQNYIKNEPIKLDEYVNTEQTIAISSGSTGYARHQKEKLYTQQELLELHEKARVLTVNDKRSKIRKPYTYKKYIVEHYDDYKEAFEQYDRDFNKLRELWDWKMSGDGLHMGTSDDDIYKKIILPVEFRLQLKKYNGGAMGRVRDIVRDLNKAIEYAEDNESGITSYTVLL